MSRDVATTKQKFYSLLCGDGRVGNTLCIGSRKDYDLLSTRNGASRTAGKWLSCAHFSHFEYRVITASSCLLLHCEKPIGSPGQVWRLQEHSHDNNWENSRKELLNLFE